VFQKTSHIYNTRDVQFPNRWEFFFYCTARIDLAGTHVDVADPVCSSQTSIQSYHERVDMASINVGQGLNEIGRMYGRSKSSVHGRARDTKSN